jgi:alkanesulfonate monooxygenase SsuD/methylene tetrahydromethanopterin reductase-like flavin-dependent oxidoreductase (luciferase family)
MTVDFGMMLAPGSLPGQSAEQFLIDLDASLPALQGHIRSLWMTDHFFWDSAPTHEAWTVMAYLAAHFPAFDIGPIVLGQSYRNPALLAKMSATLQILSGGRFILALGAGWKEDEYRAYNYDYPRAGIRIEQLDDAIEIIRRLWTQPGKVTYQGKHYKIEDALCEPKPNPAPPIMIGGSGEKMLMLVARQADWWNLSDQAIDVYTDRLGVLRRHCDTIGRDPASLRLTWQGRLSVARTEAEAVENAHRLGRDHYAGWSIEGALVGTPAQIVEKMRAFVELGVSYFIFEIIGMPDPEPLALVTEEILPHVRG